MANTTWMNFLFGLGILSVISGIYFIFQKNYIDGSCGILVGAFIVYLHLNGTKKENE